jgi:hypothetical protein
MLAAQHDDLMLILPLFPVLAKQQQQQQPASRLYVIIFKRIRERSKASPDEKKPSFALCRS